MKRTMLWPALPAAWTLLFMFCTTSHAAHPLISDDTGVQGKGKVQIEANVEYGRDTTTAAGVTEKTTAGQASAAFTYGATDTIDLVLGVPSVSAKTTQAGVTVFDESGLSDLVIEVKWRFFEKDGLSFALKPGITVPTGDERKGLGAGKTGYSLFAIATQEIGSWAFHGNLGYLRNENDPLWVDEEKNLWHVSLAAEHKVLKDLRIVGNAGMEKNPDKNATDDPAFVLLGVIYNITEDVEVDGGVKWGVTDPETDMTALAGVTFRF